MNENNNYKEEFVKIVADELGEIERGLAELNSRRVFLTENHARNFYNTKDLDRVVFQMDILRAKKSTIEGLVDYYSYFRIKQMTDLEIEDYRDAKINSYNIKIKEENRKKEEAEKRYISLKEEFDSLGKNYLSMTTEEKENSLKRSSYIISELSKLDNKNLFGIIKTIDNNLEILNRDKQEILNKSNKDIKADKLSEIETRNNIESVLGNLEKYGVSPLYKLFGALLTDPDKVEKVIQLFEDNSDLFSKINDNSIIFLIDENNPYGIRSSLNIRNFLNRDGLLKVENVELFKETIEKAAEKFYENKNMVSKELTKEKLYKLTPNYRNQEGIDFEFLKLHEDKFPNSLLNEYIYNDEIRRDSIKGIKRFFRKNIDEAAEYEEKANEAKQQIYSSIISWYGNQFVNLTTNTISDKTFETENSINKLLNDFPDYILTTEKALGNLVSNIDKEVEKKQLRKNVIEEKIRTFTEEIYKLAGENIKEPLIKISYMNSQVVYNTMLSAFNHVFSSEYIKRIEKEAKANADNWKPEKTPFIPDEATENILNKYSTGQKNDEPEDKLTPIPIEEDKAKLTPIPLGEDKAKLTPIPLEDNKAKLTPIPLGEDKDVIKILDGINSTPLEDKAKEILSSVHLEETAHDKEVDDTKIYVPKSSLDKDLIRSMSIEEIREHLREMILNSNTDDITPDEDQNMGRIR